MFTKILAVSTVGVTCLTLGGCADPNATTDATGNTASANVGYISFVKPSVDLSSISPIRSQALNDAATALGAQGALAFRSEQIDNTLKTQSDYLSKIFDFNQLLIKGNIQPPIITQGDNTLMADGTTVLRISDKTYKMLQPAKFVTAPINWRNYLWMSYSKPATPEKSLLPKNPAETQIWNDALRKGWEQGLQQANEIFANNLNRMKRDFNGMVLYRKLLASNMVSAPYVSKANLGVTGDSENIRVNDKVLRIAVNSKLIPNAKDWTPVITK